MKPFVSICTPTFNRRPFIPIMIECFLNQTYPSDRMEWIIVDDGSDPVEDLIVEANIPQIKYYKLDEKIKLGKKRNLIHSKTSGSILVYIDDDDYYPPERVEHAVDTLINNPEALCAGSSEIYVYFQHIQKMYQGGPYSKTHATAGTFAFRRELLNQTSYDDEASLAEEKLFLKNYTIPFVQLDPLKTILVFSHEHNTFDKKILLDGSSGSPLFVPSDKTIDLFIKNDYEVNIKKFFLEDILKLLPKYQHGDPIMKPDVLKQMEEMKKERESLKNAIMIKSPGQEPRALSREETVNLLQQQQQRINELEKILNNSDEMKIKKQIDVQNSVIQKLKSQLQEKDEEIKWLKNSKNTFSKIIPDNHPSSSSST